MVMKINCKRSELNLLCTLSGGQSFRWREENGKWIGGFAERIWILHQEDDFVFYEVYEKSSQGEGRKNDKSINYLKKSSDTESTNALLTRYFRLNDINLEKSYDEWSSRDKHFKDVCSNFRGIRILDQDPVENVFSFICSSNNNISRISSMVQKMCSLFGEEISVNGKKYYDFPSVSSLADPVVEKQLRSAGFGYRAQYVHQSAVKLTELGGEKWLENLKSLSYDDARQQLMLLPGVGAKVADCVCLMSLGFLGAVPVDTHIFQVAAQWYLPSLRNSKTVTPRIHKEVGDFFRQLYGPYAGWAHTILFCSSLKTFAAPTKRKSIEESKKKQTKKKIM
ncbi:hypothetical protein R5R35_002255 [Gryllus longicercus]|uniref:N-glycosylase/DNA lyase n=1 Tax=Gryllus longicercus TaxID=2509291 RepID=A0AAN9W1Y9_9ORTH